jgi:riboflavin synthase
MDRVIAEGSIAIDGISLTIAELKENSGSGKGSPSALMSVIPHTRKVTSILYKKPGDEVNVELDVLASYVGAAVAALLKGERGAAGPRESKVDLEQLRAWGYR